MKNKKLMFYIGGLFLILIASILASVVIGAVKVPLNTTTKIIISHIPFVEITKDWLPSQEAIIWDLRIPRILIAAIIGSMLSISGVAFQGVLRNSLADPYILGVSSGAALGAAITILFFNQVNMSYVLPLVAFGGSIISLILVLFLGNIQGIQRNETLILAGVIIQSLTAAILSFLIAISGDQIQLIIFWMMGSIANKDWVDFWILLPYLAIGSIYLFLNHHILNIFALGERSAAHLGIEVTKKKFTILLVASLLAATAVSVVGIIGFVGLVIPHMIRLITGPNHKNLLPIATLAGAIFLIWADTLARTVIPSREVPIGVLTAFIGAPFFAYLLRRGLRRGIS